MLSAGLRVVTSVCTEWGKAKQRLQPASWRISTNGEKEITRIQTGRLPQRGSRLVQRLLPLYDRMSSAFIIVGRAVWHTGVWKALRNYTEVWVRCQGLQYLVKSVSFRNRTRHESKMMKSQDSGDIPVLGSNYLHVTVLRNLITK